MPDAGTPAGAELLSRVRGEIDARLSELRPLVAEYERLLAGAEAAAERPRARRGAAEQAIVAALEHGSHTVAELVVVTALSGAITRDNLRRLLKAGTVSRTRREGRAAYALTRRPSA